MPEESLPAGALEERLREALLDSRNRWRELVLLSADLAFETDSWGRFVFISPDPALGWPAATLLGQPAELLLADTEGTVGFNPFRTTRPVRHRRAWLKRPDGSGMCLSFSAAPITDEEGHILGARGVAQDTTEQDGDASAMAAALRRCEVLDHILWQMRQEVLAPKMMEQAMGSLATALGAEGCAVLDVLGSGDGPTVRYRLGAGLEQVLDTATLLLEAESMAPQLSTAPDGRAVLACPTQTRFGEQGGLVLWRPPSGRGWDSEDRMLASSATGILRTILDHDSIQREMARQARTDPLTGLLNRRAFCEEVARRIERLNREGQPGTLMFLDLDHFKPLNDRRGHDVGDSALQALANLLRDAVRPSDLVARLGGDEFALWLDGMDELAAAERAEFLRTAGPAAIAPLLIDGDAPITLSTGIAAYWPSRGDDIDAVMRRADQAMYAVKRGGRDRWRVARPEGL